MGTLTRYGTVMFFQRQTETAFPWGVFTANMVGSFLFGVIWSFMEERGWVAENVRMFILVGFMGAFTTFSTFAFDNMMLARAANWSWFAWNVVLTNAAGLALVYAGFRTARIF